MAEEETKGSSCSRTVTKVDIKSENKLMMSLMNVVIKEREKKFGKKRDVKYKDKAKGKNRT